MFTLKTFAYDLKTIVSEVKSNEIDKCAVFMLYIIVAQERTPTPRSAMRAERGWVRILREIRISNSWFGKWKENPPKILGKILLAQRG